MNNEDAQIIIALLKEQNQYLKFLCSNQKRLNKWHTIQFIYHTLLVLVPLLAIVILGWYVFSLLSEYLDALNNNVNLLKDGYLSIHQSLSDVISDVYGISDKIEQTWESTTNILFN